MTSRERIDQLALHHAQNPRYVIVCDKMFGGGGQQNPTTEGENVANHAGQYYDQALGQWMTMNDPNGPQAKTFEGEAMAGLQPTFDQQSQNLADKESAMGIGSSGAATHDFGALKTAQSGVLAQAIAPFYQNAQSQAGGLLQGKAGGQSSGYSGQYGQTAGENFQAQQAQAAAMQQALASAGQAAGMAGGG